MNRHQRRALASKVRDPNGVPLTPRLLHVKVSASDVPRKLAKRWGLA